MKDLIGFFISLSFFRSFQFIGILFSKKKTDVLIYYPQHFNSESNSPFILTQIINTLKENNISYLLVEEPNLKHKIRNSSAIPVDVFWMTVILLRKCFYSRDYHTVDNKIGYFFSKYMVNHQFANIITISQSFQSILRGMFPNSDLYDYQHGLISRQYYGYIDGKCLSQDLISNQCKLLLYGSSVRQKLLHLKHGSYLKDNSFVVGSPYKSHRLSHQLFNHSILFTLQFTSSHTEQENRLFLKKTIHFFEEIEQSDLDVKFYVKMHPRFENCIDDSPIYNFNFVTKAPDSLNDCFKLCTLHMTEYSSVVFDALMQGIPTVLTGFSEHLNIFVDEYHFPQITNKPLLERIKELEVQAFYQSICDKQLNGQRVYIHLFHPFVSSKR